MWGDKLQHVIDEMVKPYPGRFIVFTQLDWSKVDDPDFGQEMVRQLDDAVARGARGLKFLKDLGLGVRLKSGKLLAIDDPRLDPVWSECGRLGIPVSIHTGDPEAFFLPTDGKNERYEELIGHPDWSFYGPQYPKLEELLEARNRVFARHPETHFVSLHMGWPENLPWVSRMDRLLTYAEGRDLDDEQLRVLKTEMEPGAVREALFSELQAALARSMSRVQAFDSGALEQGRRVGRKQLPTTVGGLLVHVADHTQRHVGQAITTARIVSTRQLE